MKIETLKERIKNTENKINKINTTLEKHNKQLEKKGNKLIEQGINLKSYDKYNYRQTDLYWDICDYEDKLEAIENNDKKLKDATTDLQKYQEQLKNQLTKDAETENIIPPVLDQFLANWKKKLLNISFS